MSEIVAAFAETIPLMSEVDLVIEQHGGWPGAYCLFRALVEGTRQAETSLVQLRDRTDPETDQRYTVKRYDSEKVATDGSWQHTRITLKPVNPDFDPIVLTGTDEGHPPGTRRPPGNRQTPGSAREHGRG